MNFLKMRTLIILKEKYNDSWIKHLPEYRRQGLARELVRQYALKEKKNNREKLILTCLDAKVPMYLDFGFTDHGISDSVWGGEVWHEMSLDINNIC